MIRKYHHKFTNAFYILPTLFIEWLDKDGKREYTIGIEWLKYGIYLEKQMKTRNWVAKHARTFNKAKVFRDRKKYYRKEGWKP